jgi:hypothetical protein
MLRQIMKIRGHPVFFLTLGIIDKWGAFDRMVGNCANPAQNSKFPGVFARIGVFLLCLDGLVKQLSFLWPCPLE